MSQNIRFSTLEKEGAMQASKWSQMQVLLSLEELKQLFANLGNIYLYNISTVLKAGEEEISLKDFANHYADYLAKIQSGEELNEDFFRSKLTVVMTLEPEALYALKMPGHRQLLRLSKPVVYIQMHCMGFSKEEAKFRPMIFGKGSLAWGLQFAYPQLYLNPKNKQVEKLNDEKTYPNTKLFKELRRSLRELSLPMSFLFTGDEGTRKVNSPIRIGKNCLDWVNQLSQLKHLNIKVGQL